MRVLAIRSAIFVYADLPIVLAKSSIVAVMSEYTVPSRKIIHVDMDAFYASVEQRDNPKLRGKPLAVGGSAKRGVVAAASYEARQFGVRSAMPGITARRRCPQLLFVRPRFDVYQEVSQHIRAIFARYSDLVEPLSLDEAYLDVTDDKASVGSATQIAERIRRDIRAELRLTASAGVSYNKFVAKVASDQNKPDGICVVRPAEGPDFVAQLSARRFYGVGPRTAERMAKLGIHTGADLRGQSLAFLEQHFGSSAFYLHQASRGQDDRPVRPNRARKSVGAERTYAADLFDENQLLPALDTIIDTVWERIERHQTHGRTITLKVKYADFQQITRSRTVSPPLAERAVFEEVARSLLQALLPSPKGIRLLGLTLSGLERSAAERPEGEGEAHSLADGVPVQSYLAF